MKITYTLTKKHLWSHRKSVIQKQIFDSFILHVFDWLIGFTICCFLIALVNYFVTRDFWFGLAVAAFQCMLGGTYYLLTTKQRYDKAFAKTPGILGEREIELGKFDVRWGAPKASSYYYHWTQFEEITETTDAIYFSLGRKGTLILPKSAFASLAEMNCFLTEAKSRWETAKFNQRHFNATQEGIWPPAPRSGV